MRLMVIGDPARQKKDAPLVGNRIFDETTYAPIDKIRIGTGFGTQIVYKEEPVDVDAVLPIPTRRHLPMFMSAVAAFQSKAYLPFGMEGLLLFSRNAVAMPRLRQLGFVSGYRYYGLSSSVFTGIRIEMPAEILVGGRQVAVETRKQLLDVIRMHKGSKDIIMREALSSPVVESLVTDGKVVASIRHARTKTIKTRLDEDFKEQLADAVRLLGSDFGSVRTCENEIIGASLAPDFSLFNRIHGRRVSDSVLRPMLRRVDEERTIFDNVLTALRRFF
ncbi:MAG: hypothetical protein HY518_05490 [Candidatus Aenigmarchaeota archaeon]|nr:hypothetical protein [Candidatus Aenigmarchaeota archaeon]